MLYITVYNNTPGRRQYATVANLKKLLYKAGGIRTPLLYKVNFNGDDRVPGVSVLNT